MGGGAGYLLDDIVAFTERMNDDGVDITTDFPCTLSLYSVDTSLSEQSYKMRCLAGWGSGDSDRCRPSTRIRKYLHIALPGVSCIINVLLMLTYSLQLGTQE